MNTSSSNKEDYLKAIYENNGVDAYVPNKILANTLNVSPASVTEMVEKLQADGLLDYKPYTGAKLTETGRNHTIQVIRNHRIIETFLFEKLGYSLLDLHRLSEEMEHIKDTVFFSKLYHFLGEPKTCPHGGIIPTETHYNELYTTPLTSYTPGQTVTLKRVVDTASLLEFLASINLQVGDKLTIQNKDAFNEIISFTINDGQTVFHINEKQAGMLFADK